MRLGESGGDVSKLNQSGEGSAGKILLSPHAVHVISSKVSSLTTAIIALLNAIVQGKVRISICAGVFAGLLVALGFLFFDADKENWMVKQRYPRAANASERYLLYATDLFAEGESDKAEKILRKLLAGNTTGMVRADALLLLAQTIGKSRQDEAAGEEIRELYQEFIANYPTDQRVPTARLHLADAFGLAQFFYESNSEYEKLLRGYPGAGTPGIEFLIARNYYWADTHPRAVNLLQKILKEAPEADVLLDARLLLGRIYAEMGNREQAESHLLALIQDAPGTAQAASALQFLAQSALQRKAYRETIEYCTHWLCQSPVSQGREEMMLLFGKAQLELHEPARAIDAASDVIAFSPESAAVADSLILRGNAFEALQRPEDAETSYREAIDAFPKNPLPYKELARLKVSTGDIAKAVYLAEQVCQTHPDDDKMRIELAKLYWMNGESVRGEGLLQNFVRERQLSPEIGGAYLLLADIQAGVKQPDLAYETLERFLATMTTTIKQQVAFERQGDLLAQAGLYEEALEAYLLAREKDEKSPVLALKTAETFFQLKKFDDCLREITSVGGAAVSPAERFDLLFLQARAQTQLGNHREAHRSIHEAISLRSGQEKISILALLMQVNLELGDEGEAAKVFDATRKIVAMENQEAPLEARRIVLDWAERLYQKQEYMRAAEIYSSISMPQFSESDAAWAVYQAGNCYYKRADYSRAREAYAQLKAKFPHSEWLSFAEQRTALLDLTAKNAFYGAGNEGADDARID